MTIRQRCLQLWEEPESFRNGSLFARLLEVFSAFYRFGVTLRNDRYDNKRYPSVKLPCKVISVGNITVGGTGKTPTVIMLARLLQKAGCRPAVLSRGYGSRQTAPVHIVSDGASVLLDPQAGGDEPVLIARSLPGVPVLTGPDRSLTGKAALSRMGADVLILDDGFQHRRLERDLDIVLLDIKRPWGNGFLLPRGPLREPPARALQRADILIRTGNVPGGESRKADGSLEKGSDFGNAGGELPVFRGIHQPSALIGRDQGEVDMRHLAGKRILACAGIGSPQRFRGTLESLGADVVEFLTYPDHYRYRSEDLRFIEQAARKARAEAIVTTEKDEIKWMPSVQPAVPLFFLCIEMRIEPREPFARLIAERLGNRVR